MGHLHRPLAAGLALSVVVAAGLAAHGLDLIPSRSAAPEGVSRSVDTVTDELAEPGDVGAGPAVPPHLQPSTPGHLDVEGLEPGQIVEHTAASSNDQRSLPTPTGVPGGADAAAVTPPPTTAPAPDPTPTTTAPATPTSTTTTTSSPPPPTTTTTTTPPPSTIPEKKDGSTPVAVSDSFSGAANAILTLDVLANDSDPDGSVGDLTLTLLTEPTHANRFSVAADHFRYRSYPANNGSFSPTDSFTYQICDTDGNCASATVTLSISG